jgi:hypothetical protein
LPLPAATRIFFEPRLGHDLSAVRVHTDEAATRSALSIGARAYTVGADIAFSPGEYDVGSTQGLRLLAHELVHTVQTDRALAVSTAPAPPVAVRAKEDVAHRQLYPPIPIMISRPQRSVEVTAVDARGAQAVVGFLRGNVSMTSVSSMVDNVLRYLGATRSLLRLNLVDHGNASSLEIGDDVMSTAADVSRFAPALGRLRSRFASGGFVHMQNCEAGQNRPVICALADAFGVRVFAGTGMDTEVPGLFEINLGRYVSCGPGGAWNPNAGFLRPSTPSPPPDPDLTA